MRHCCHLLSTWCKLQLLQLIEKKSFSSQRDVDVAPFGFKSPQLDASHVQHASGCDGFCLCSILVSEIDDFPNAGLDDQLCTLVAGKQVNVNDAALQVSRVLVHDSIHFSMTDVRVLRVQHIVRLVPWKFII